MGDYDLRDMTFSVSIDFEEALGEREVIFETGGGTVGTSIVYEIGNTLVLRSVGNGGTSLATAQYTLTDAQLAAGELEVLWTYQVDNGSGEQVIALYLDKALVASETMDIGGDWSGSDQATFGLQSGVTGNGENGTIPGTAFVSGVVNLEEGLRFWGDTLFERTGDNPPVIIDPNPADRQAPLTINRVDDITITLSWPSYPEQTLAVEYSQSMETNDWVVIADSLSADGQTAAFEDTEPNRTRVASGYYRVKTTAGQ